MSEEYRKFQDQVFGEIENSTARAQRENVTKALQGLTRRTRVEVEAIRQACEKYVTYQSDVEPALRQLANEMRSASVVGGGEAPRATSATGKRLRRRCGKLRSISTTR
jgi:hypothetical protein